MSGSGMPDFLSLAELAAATGAALRAGPAVRPIVGVGTDTREDLSGRLFVALRGETHDGHDHLAAAVAAGAAALLVERTPEASGLGPIPILTVADTRRALAALAAAWRDRLSLARCVAITGSGGKTTTRRLVEAVLSRRWSGTASPKSFNNDIGVPLTLLSARRDDRFLAIEIGMNHPGEIAPLAALARPEVGIVTMVGRAHLEGLGSVEAIAEEKASLLGSLPADGVAVFHGDRPVLVEAVARLGLPCRTVRFGLGSDNDLRLVARTVTPGSPLQRIETADGFAADLALPGEHNALNALAAVAAARHLGFADREIAEGLALVRPAAMRLERVEVGPIAFHNDAYNANPDAVLAALATFAELAAGAARRVVILGDMLELGAASEALHEEIGRGAAAIDARAGLAEVVAVGRFAPSIERGLRAGDYRGSVATFPSLDPDALDAVLGRLRPGDEVLLKGSRGSAMERVLAAARAAMGNGAAASR